MQFPVQTVLLNGSGQNLFKTKIPSLLINSFMGLYFGMDIWKFSLITKEESLWMRLAKFCITWSVLTNRISLLMQWTVWATESDHHSAQKWGFLVKISSVNVTNSVTFTEETLNGKLHFLCSVRTNFLI